MDETIGYKVHLPTSIGTQGFGYIGFWNWALVVDHSNKRGTRCKECKERVAAGEGIFHRGYSDNGFVCLNCARKLIYKYGGKFGFIENAIFNLQACTYDHKVKYFSAQEVADNLLPCRKKETAL